MGCGEYNPLSLSATDAESRRAVVFLLDPVAGPPKAPCKLRSIQPCQSSCGLAPTAASPDGKPPYRCKVYRSVAAKCPCQAGADLSHDLVVRIPYSLQDADDLPHTFTLSSDDGTISQTRSLSSDCRANDDRIAEFVFTHLPENHAYTLECDDGENTYAIFEDVPYARLPEVLAGAGGAAAAGLGPLDEPEDAGKADEDSHSGDADSQGNAGASDGGSGEQADASEWVDTTAGAGGGDVVDHNGGSEVRGEGSAVGDTSAYAQTSDIANTQPVRTRLGGHTTVASMCSSAADPRDATMNEPKMSASALR